MAPWYHITMQQNGDLFFWARYDQAFLLSKTPCCIAHIPWCSDALVACLRSGSLEAVEWYRTMTPFEVLPGRDRYKLSRSLLESPRNGLSSMRNPFINCLRPSKNLGWTTERFFCGGRLIWRPLSAIHECLIDDQSHLCDCHGHKPADEFDFNRF